MSVVEQDNERIWWGSFSLPVGSAGRWRIGPAAIRLERFRHEWRVVRESDGDSQDNTVSVELPLDGKSRPEAQTGMIRFAMQETRGEIRLLPAMADRSMVVRPENPFYVLPGQEVTLYAGVPLWLNLEVGKPPIRLLDIPLVRPSDTWFGPSTMEGELCYASRIRGKLEIGELSFRPHRAISVILLRNNSHSPVLLERFNLPAQYLALYQSAEGHLWTQPVNLSMGEMNQAASLSLKQVAPAAARGAKLVSQPRLKPDKPILQKTLNLLIG